MRQWLYVISEESDKFFTLQNGTKEKVSYNNFKKLVLSRNLSEEAPWHIWNYSRQVQRGDEVFIYHTSKKFRKGIIGYAKVSNVDGSERIISLAFNRNKCRSLLRQPIPAEEVDRWFQYKRPNILSLDPFRKELDHFLRLRGWKRNTFSPEEEEIFKELHLKAFKKIVVAIGKNVVERKLIHDIVLKPIANILQDNRFEVRTRNFGKLRIDLIGVKNNLVVIVEGKTNKLGHGREEARQAFGQLYEYLWFIERSTNKILQSKLWIAFQQKPNKSVIEFLEDYNFIVSYIENRKVKFTEESEKLFYQFC